MLHILSYSCIGSVLAVIILIIFMIIISIKESKKVVYPAESLQNKITTEYFEINIAYNMLGAGGVSATFTVVEHPKGVRRVIYNGGSWCLESSFQDCLTIKADTIKELRKDVSWTIHYTKEKVQAVEKNLEAVETNKLMLEVNDGR